MRSRAGASEPMGASRMSTRWADLFHVGCVAALVVPTLVLGLSASRGDGYPSKFSFGETATEQEIGRLAIAIPAEGKGLLAARGDYAKGKQVYETSCAAWQGADLMGVSGLPDMPSGASL